MAASSGIRVVSDTLGPGIKKFPDDLDRALSTFVDYGARNVESYARMNAPWVDRTGNARNGLRATTEHDAGSRHAIILSHSVPYGIWLEVRHEGRYAIIAPTVEVKGRELMNAARGLIGRMH